MALLFPVAQAQFSDIIGTLGSFLSGANMERRQTSCQVPCAWISVIVPCQTEGCVCTAFLVAGNQTVTDCATCIATSNATLASEVLTIERYCLAAISSCLPYPI